MGSPRNIFKTCSPRPDVLAGATKDERFAADLAEVIKGTAPDEYRVPGAKTKNEG